MLHSTISPFEFTNLAKDSQGSWNRVPQVKPIVGFSYDTRQLAPGHMFVALKTEKRDGHDFLQDAFEKGATALLVEKEDSKVPLPQLIVKDTLTAFQSIAKAHRRRFKGTIIGLTGSCGKTTTKDLLAHLLNKERTHATELNINNTLGVPATLMELDSKRHEFGVIEAGMNMRGEMEKIAWTLEPDFCIFTLIAPVHLQMVGNIDDIVWEKTFLGRATSKNGTILFLNSSWQFQEFKKFSSNAHILVKEGETQPEVPASQITLYSVEELDLETYRLSLKSKRFSNRSFILPILSDGMYQNFALAFTTCSILGLNESEIRERLHAWIPSKHRGQTYFYKNQIYYADCYNANPVAVRDAIKLFNKRFSPVLDRLYILGCMGELGAEADRFHYETGSFIKLRLQDKAIVIGTHKEIYYQGMLDAGNSRNQLFLVDSKEEIHKYMDDFEGTIFLKGSKPYKLWELLPKNATLQTNLISLC